MTPPRDGGGESLLQTCERAQSEAGMSGRVQSGQNSEPCEERGSGGGDCGGSRMQQPGGPKESR